MFPKGNVKEENNNVGCTTPSPGQHESEMHAGARAGTFTPYFTPSSARTVQHSSRPTSVYLTPEFQMLPDHVQNDSSSAPKRRKGVMKSVGKLLRHCRLRTSSSSSRNKDLPASPFPAADKLQSDANRNLFVESKNCFVSVFGHVEDHPRTEWCFGEECGTNIKDPEKRCKQYAALRENMWKSREDGWRSEEHPRNDEELSKALQEYNKKNTEDHVNKHEAFTESIFNKRQAKFEEEVNKAEIGYINGKREDELLLCKAEWELKLEMEKSDSAKQLEALTKEHKRSLKECEAFKLQVEKETKEKEEIEKRYSLAVEECTLMKLRAQEEQKKREEMEEWYHWACKDKAWSVQDNNKEKMRIERLSLLAIAECVQLKLRLQKQTKEKQEIESRLALAKEELQLKAKNENQELQCRVCESKASTVQSEIPLEDGKDYVELLQKQLKTLQEEEVKRNSLCDQLKLENDQLKMDKTIAERIITWYKGVCISGEKEIHKLELLVKPFKDQLELFATLKAATTSNVKVVKDFFTAFLRRQMNREKARYVRRIRKENLVLKEQVSALSHEICNNKTEIRKLANFKRQHENETWYSEGSST